MRNVFLTATMLLLPAGVCLAQNSPFDAKLGLWETTTKTEIGGRAMSMPQIPPETLAKLPPEQRARIEAMMKGRGAGGPGTMTVKSCLTKESLDRGMGLGQSDKSCTRTLVSSSAAKQVMHIDCNHDGTKTSGDMTLERVDTNHVKGNLAMKAGEGHPGVNMSFESQWIGADCGDVKPAGVK